MTISPRLRRLSLTVHVATSVGWLGAVTTFLPLALVGLTSSNPETVRGAYLVMEPAAWLVLVPLAFASLGSGLVQGLSTAWGLFRHYWVLFKLGLTAFATLVLLTYMPSFPTLASIAADPTADIDLSGRMLTRAIERQGEHHPRLLQMDAQVMGFRDESFDIAVGTFVFCSVPDARRGLAEVRRVLQPGGRLLLLEHVRSGSPVLGRLMDWLNPFAVRAMGVNINRDTVETVRRAGFEIEEDRPLDRRRIFRLIEAVRPSADEDARENLHPIRERT